MKRGNSSRIRKRPPQGRGQPPYDPTEDDRSLFTALMVNGVSVAQAARILRLDEKTVRKHFKAEIQDGRDMANAKVASRLFEQASGDGKDSPSVTARIFWLKARAGWKDGHTISNPDGSPLLGDLPNATMAALGVAASKVLSGKGADAKP